jgi:uncharacterized BrkB/YihY/UPF0761 family membrane protein
MTIDEWAITLTVFVLVMALFLFIGPRVYRSKNGSEAIFNKGEWYFHITAVVAASIPAGAVMLTLAFLPMTSTGAYVIGGFITALGCGAGSVIFHYFLDLLVEMDTPAPEEALESQGRLRKPRRGERPSRPRRRGQEDGR